MLSSAWYISLSKASTTVALSLSIWMSALAYVYFIIRQYSSFPQQKSEDWSEVEWSEAMRQNLDRLKMPHFSIQRQNHRIALSLQCDHSSLLSVSSHRNSLSLQCDHRSSLWGSHNSVELSPADRSQHTKAFGLRNEHTLLTLVPAKKWWCRRFSSGLAWV